MKKNILILTLILLLPLAAFAKPKDRAGAPEFDHIVVAIMENKGYSDIIGNPEAPYINALARASANMTQAYGVWHLSQPNYFALFTGSMQGVTDNEAHFFNNPTIAGQLAKAHKRFIGYAEAGSPRKHTPWLSFADSLNSGADFAAFPKGDYSRLPDLAFVIPNDQDNMHDGTIAQGDAWLKANLESYVQWAKTHKSLFILVWDEDNDNENNRVVTLFSGSHVVPGNYSEPIIHYNTFRTIQASFDLPAFRDFTAQPIKDIWYLDSKHDKK